jgi:hypothetical protein
MEGIDESEKTVQRYVLALTQAGWDRKKYARGAGSFGEVKEEQ